MAKLHLKANKMNMKLLLRAKEGLTKAKVRAKKLNENMKGKARKIGRKMKKMGGRIKVGYAKTLKGFVVLNERVKVKRVTFCVWFMYNCHSMKLMCLECWLIENPHVIMKNIKKRESSCTTLIPIGYGVVIHKSLILTPFEYFDDSKKALKGEVLINFGDQKPHGPSDSCMASNVEIEKGLFPIIFQGSNSLNNLSSKELSKEQLQCELKSSSNIGSTPSSKLESKNGLPISSKQGSRVGSKSISNSTSRAGTPPSSPEKQHTHKLLPSR
jgi:hypothetical protein